MDGAGFEGGHRGPAPDLDAVTDHGRAHQRRHVRVEGAHDLRGLVDDGHRRPEADVGLGHLEADVAAPHHDDVPGQAPAVPVEQALGVGQGLHAEHGLAVDARHVRSVGAGPGGHDQLVVGEAHGAAVLVVPDLDLSGVGVDGHRLVAEAHVDAVVVPELLRRPGDQFLDPLQVPGDEIGDPTGRVADPRALLQRHDVQVAVEAPRLCGSGHPPSVPADHDQPLAHPRTLLPVLIHPACRRRRRTVLRSVQPT